MSQLSNLPTIKDVFDHINDKYPNWIFCSSKSFSSDYDYLNKNWDMTLNSHRDKGIEIEKQKIILVSGFNKDDYLSFAEVLTRVGFIVRSVDDFQLCSECGLALPTISYYNKMKINNMKIPHFWLSRCSNC
jgi:hypothetical protein